MRIGDPCFTSPPMWFYPPQMVVGFSRMLVLSHADGDGFHADPRRSNRFFLIWMPGIPPAGRDVACHVRIMRWYLTHYRHSDADAFPEDSGIFSRRSHRLIRSIGIWSRWIPSANDFVWPIDSTCQQERGMPRPHNALVFNVLSPFGCGRVSRRWWYFFTQMGAD